MTRHIHLQPHLGVEELERRYRAEKEPSERSWWQILWLLSQSYTAVQIAAVTGCSAYWIGQSPPRHIAPHRSCAASGRGRQRGRGPSLPSNTASNGGPGQLRASRFWAHPLPSGHHRQHPLFEVELAEFAR